MADHYYYLTTVPSPDVVPEAAPVPGPAVGPSTVTGSGFRADTGLVETGPSEAAQNQEPPETEEGTILLFGQRTTETAEGGRPVADSQAEKAPAESGPIQMLFPAVEESEHAFGNPPVSSPVTERPSTNTYDASQPTETVALFPVEREQAAAATAAVPESTPASAEREGGWVSGAAFFLSIVLFALAGTLVVAEFIRRKRLLVRGSGRPATASATRRRQQGAKQNDVMAELLRRKRGEVPVNGEPKEAKVSGGRKPGTKPNDVIVVPSPGRTEPSGLGTTPVLFPDAVEPAEEEVDAPAKPVETATPPVEHPAPFGVKAPPKPKKLF